MKKLNFSEIIYPSITGYVNTDWQKQLKEINKLKLSEVAVFLSAFDKKERDHLYKFLLKSSIKRVPLVHLRDDTDASDIKFFIKNFKTKYFNIHERFFEVLNQWKGYWNKLYLELNYNDEVPKDVDMEKISGFCIDLSHLKSAIARGTQEAFYVLSRKGKAGFACNHLNGFDPVAKDNKHTVTDLEDFDYLITLPRHVFGKVIVIEVYNSIEEQLRFKEYLVKLLNNYFHEN